MEAEIKAGAKLDMLTKSELQEVMDGLDFNVKIGRGLKFRRISGVVTALNGELLETHIGPEAGFTWAVQSSTSYAYDTATPANNQTILYFLNNRDSLANMLWFEFSNVTGSDPKQFPKTSIIIHSGEYIIPKYDVGTPVTITDLHYMFSVIEVPTFSEGLLNL